MSAPRNGGSHRGQSNNAKNREQQQQQLASSAARTTTSSTSADGGDGERRRSEDESEPISLSGVSLLVGAMLGAAAVGLYSYFTGGSSSTPTPAINSNNSDHGNSLAKSRIYKMPASPVSDAATDGRRDGEVVQVPPVPSDGSSVANRNDHNDDDASVRCVACLDSPAVMLFSECGHLCCCEACVQHMARNVKVAPREAVLLACPQCRQRGPLERIYLP